MNKRVVIIVQDHSISRAESHAQLNKPTCRASTSKVRGSHRPPEHKADTPLRQGGASVSTVRKGCTRVAQGVCAHTKPGVLKLS